MGELRGCEPAAGFPLLITAGRRGMRSVLISLCILIATIALVVGFASLPRSFVAAVGVGAAVAALAAVIFIEV